MMTWLPAIASLIPLSAHGPWTLIHQAPTPSPSPFPAPMLDEGSAQSTPMVLWLVLGLMTAAVLLGLSMRRHLRKVPADLNVATRAGATGQERADAASNDE